MSDSFSPYHRPVVWVAQGVWVESIFRGIARYAFEQGWIVDSRMRWPNSQPPAPMWKPDGIIVFTGPMESLVPVVKAAGVPVVDIETYADHYGAPKVIGDDRAIGALAAKHLVGCGISSLVAVSETGAMQSVRERMAGFRKQAALSGMPCVEVSSEAFDPVELTRGGPIGVFTGGDLGALDIMRRCLDAGVPVPDRVAILGADNTDLLCELAPVPLSSVSIAFEEKGRRAAELLHALMRGEKRPEAPVVVSPLSIVERASTMRMLSGHPELDRVMRYFFENARRGVGVAELCKGCGVSVRTVQHLMLRHLGKTPLELLRDYRLALADRLETSRQFNLDGVAVSSGFGGRSALTRARKQVRRRG